MIATGPAEEHKQLEWKAPQACLVAFAKTPCRTVRYHEYSFGSSFGFDGITNVETIEATNQDGSEAKIMTIVRRKFWLLPAWTVKAAELFLREQNRTVVIDHEKKIFATQHHNAEHGYQSWEQDDLQCSHAKTHYLYLSERLRDSVVAGFHVVGYGGRDDRGADYEVYFAPSLGCQPLRFQTAMRGFLGWTSAKYEKTVDQYEIGPPSADLFTIPAGYKRVSWHDLTDPFKTPR
jgi:hypothetical protein